MIKAIEKKIEEGGKKTGSAGWAWGKEAVLCRAIREGFLDEVMVEQWPEGRELAFLWGVEGSSALRRDT